ncbi:MAG: acylneuraminate cytidylyltransferase family protein [Candidatus Omnitrophica bacterium]|nr:acylneuraminate cytidylyltransferase family protein [Candidatus Omnitrophota bacterium]
MILATIAARGGSKGVPQKNIRPLMGKPLIGYTIEQALQCPLINEVIVTTDSVEIAETAKSFGAKVPFLRPAELATDAAGKLPALQHAVQYAIKEMKLNPEYVVDLDPTSPLRLLEDIAGCIALIQKGNCDSVITGYRSNKNPYFNMVEINEAGFAEVSKNAGSVILGRQSAPIVYAMNASIYVWKTEVLLNQKSIISGKVKLYEMPQDRSIDIDSLVDFKIVELLLKEKVSHGPI